MLGAQTLAVGRGCQSRLRARGERYYCTPGPSYRRLPAGTQRRPAGTQPAVRGSKTDSLGTGAAYCSLLLLSGWCSECRRDLPCGSRGTSSGSDLQIYTTSDTDPPANQTGRDRYMSGGTNQTSRHICHGSPVAVDVNRRAGW